MSHPVEIQEVISKLKLSVGLVDIDQVKDEIKSCIHILEDKNRIYIAWDVDDVLKRGSELGIPLSLDEAQEILGLILAKHDANVGITWDVMDRFIEEF